MTLPSEERRSLKRTVEFLQDLLDPKRTPKVPAKIRKEAGCCLRHYPYAYYLDEMYQIRESGLIDDLRYEMAEGIHTYHQCNCGRGHTRQGQCVLCLLEGYFFFEKENQNENVD